MATDMGTFTVHSAMHSDDAAASMHYYQAIHTYSLSYMPFQILPCFLSSHSCWSSAAVAVHCVPDLDTASLHNSYLNHHIYAKQLLPHAVHELLCALHCQSVHHLGVSTMFPDTTSRHQKVRCRLQLAFDSHFATSHTTLHFSSPSHLFASNTLP